MSRLPRQTGRVVASATAAPLLLAALVGACADTPTAPAVPTAAPVTAKGGAAAGDSIPDEWIVTLRPGADVEGMAGAFAAANGGRVRHAYRHALTGFAAHLPARAVAALRRHPDVLAVEPDRVVRASATQTNLPSWGLDRIDQAALPLDGAFTYGATGAGVNVYIVDSGIRTAHQEFGGRAAGAYTAIADGQGTNDCNGHGTHVAGTAGGATAGVAKGAALWAVRVLGCDGSGSSSGVIAGIDWVAQNGRRPAVLNMSLGGGYFAALNTAVANAVAAGVTVVVAAGNENVDACQASPASAPSAITVGASTRADAQAGFSNWGTCVDLYAPGEGIVSAYHTGDATYAGMSGTSMAAPHVAGAAALVLQGTPAATPAQVTQRLVERAALGRLGALGAGSPNRLLQVAGLEAPIGGPTPAPTPVPPPVDAAPVASFVVSCNGYRSCTFDARGSTDDRGIVRYEWSFGDGATRALTLPTTSYSYWSTGTFTVTLRVVDAAGQSSRTARTVTITRLW